MSLMYSVTLINLLPLFLVVCTVQLILFWYLFSSFCYFLFLFPLLQIISERFFKFIISYFHLYLLHLLLHFHALILHLLLHSLILTFFLSLNQYPITKLFYLNFYLSYFSFDSFRHLYPLIYHFPICLNDVFSLHVYLCSSLSYLYYDHLYLFFLYHQIIHDYFCFYFYSYFLSHFYLLFCFCWISSFYLNFLSYLF